MRGRFLIPKLITAIVIAVVARPAVAQSSADDGSSIRISILTMGVGDEVYEKFGHIAVRIQDPFEPYPDVCYNWGVFDFHQKNFYVNFIQGRMLYSSAGYDTLASLEDYRQLKRTVLEQVLHLTPAQKIAIERRCIIGTQPRNRDYRYDYYRDNCSTRVRDLVDRVVAGQIKQQTEQAPAGVSFRWHTRRLTADVTWLYYFLQMALGHPVDAPISKWQEMFLPEKLRSNLRDVTVVDPDGKRVPLVESERILIQGDEPPERTVPPNRVPASLIASLIVSGAILGLGQLTLKRRRGARLGLALVAGFWTLLLGVGGCLMAWGWFFTDHTVAQQNENILQFCFLAIVLMPLVWWGSSPLPKHRRCRGANTAFWLAITLAVLSVMGLLIKVLPMFHQPNADIIALCLPANLALGWTMWRLRKQRSAAA